MINRDRDAAPSTVRDALKQLSDRGVKLSKDIPAAVAVLDRIESDAPADPSPADLQNAVLAGADDAQLDALTLRQLGHQLRRNAFHQARLTAAQRALAAVRGDAQSIHAQLKTRADDVIAHLNAVAELGDGVTLEGLVRDDRQDDAALVANVEIAAAELDVLHGLRQTIWDGQSFGVGQIDCHTWVDPTVAGAHGSGHGVAYLLSAIRGGGQLHYPTPDEAVEAAQPIARRLLVLAAQDQPERRETVTRPVMA